MFRRGWIFSGCILLSLLAAWPAAAETLTVFGPQRYDKPKGSPVGYQASFTAPDPGGSYSLCLESGSDGLQMVKNVSLAFNGSELLDSAALRAENPTCRPIYPTAGDNALELQLKGQGGNLVTVSILCSGCRPLRITSPDPGTTASGNLSVQGEIFNPAGEEVGITVNGTLAQTDGRRFVASHVTPEAMTGRLTARAVFADGRTLVDEIVIHPGPEAPAALQLRSYPEGGLAPLTVTLTPESSGPLPGQVPQVSCSGPGTVVLEADGAGYRATLPVPGLYLCSLAGSSGPLPPVPTPPQPPVPPVPGYAPAPPLSFAGDTIGISVLAQETLDARLREKWQTLRSALVDGQLDRAVALTLQHRQNAYRSTFTKLAGQFEQIFGQPEELAFKRGDGSLAEYDNYVLEGNQAFSYPVLFEQDVDGLWRISQF